jgi:predicted dehydrogenase
MIAGGYDEQSGDADAILSHAGAYTRHPGFRIVGCVEPDNHRREEFMSRWDVAVGYSTLDEALDAGLPFDVVSLCTPTNQHAAALERLLTGPQRLVFCEKPLTDDLETAEVLARRYFEAGKFLAVNYTRRWDPVMAETAARIASGSFGPVQFVVAHYTKGILHNGGHLIDLLHMWLGPLSIITVLRAAPTADPDDPAVDAVLRSANDAPVYLIAADWRSFELFEVQIVTHRCRIILSQAGFSISIQTREQDIRYPGYFRLIENRPTSTGLNGALLEAVHNFADVLDGRATLACDAQTALAAQRLCVELRDRAQVVRTVESA